MPSQIRADRPSRRTGCPTTAEARSPDLVPITRPSSGAPHRRIHRASPIDRRCGAAIAELQRDEPELGEWMVRLLPHRCRPTTHAHAMKSIAMDAVLVGQIEIDCIGGRPSRNRTMKGRIEHGYDRNVGTKNIPSITNPSQAFRIVQWCQLGQQVDRVYDRLICRTASPRIRKTGHMRLTITSLHAKQKSAIQAVPTSLAGFVSALKVTTEQ